jgi:hypothetical protein
MTGVRRDTIMRLGVKVGQGCTASPQTAVKAAIVQEFRSLEPKKEN